MGKVEKSRKIYTSEKIIFLRISNFIRPSKLIENYLDQTITIGYKELNCLVGTIYVFT